MGQDCLNKETLTCPKRKRDQLKIQTGALENIFKAEIFEHEARKISLKN